SVPKVAMVQQVYPARVPSPAGAPQPVRLSPTGRRRPEPTGYPTRRCATRGSPRPRVPRNLFGSALQGVADQVLHKDVRGETGEVTDALTLSDQFDGDTRLLLNGEDKARLGGAVEF